MDKQYVCKLCRLLAKEDGDEVMPKECLLVALDSIKKHYHDVESKNKKLLRQMRVMDDMVHSAQCSNGIEKKQVTIPPRGPDGDINVSGNDGNGNMAFPGNFNGTAGNSGHNATSVSGAYNRLVSGNGNGISNAPNRRGGIFVIPEASASALYRHSAANNDATRAYGCPATATLDNINYNRVVDANNKNYFTRINDSMGIAGAPFTVDANIGKAPSSGIDAAKVANCVNNPITFFGNEDTANKENDYVKHFKVPHIYNYYSDAIGKIPDDYKNQMNAICGENAYKPRDIPNISGGLECIGTSSQAATMRNASDPLITTIDYTPSKIPLSFRNSRVDKQQFSTINCTNVPIMSCGSGRLFNHTFTQMPNPNMINVKPNLTNIEDGSVPFKFIFADRPSGNLLNRPKNPLFTTFENYVEKIENIALSDEQNIQPETENNINAMENNGALNMFIYNNEPKFTNMGSGFVPLTKKRKATTAVDNKIQKVEIKNAMPEPLINTSDPLVDYRQQQHLQRLKRKRQCNISGRGYNNKLREPRSNTPDGFWNPLMKSMNESELLLHDKNDQPDACK